MRKIWDSADQEIYEALKKLTPEQFEWVKREFLPDRVSVNSSHNQDITQVDEASIKSSKG